MKSIPFKLNLPRASSLFASGILCNALLLSSFCFAYEDSDFSSSVPKADQKVLDLAKQVCASNGGGMTECEREVIKKMMKDKPATTPPSTQPTAPKLEAPIASQPSSAATKPDSANTSGSDPISGQAKLFADQQRELEAAKLKKQQEDKLAQERLDQAEKLAAEKARLAKQRQDQRRRNLRPGNLNEMREFNEDQGLAFEGINSVNKNSSFDPSKANRAHDKELRDDLRMISIAQHARKEYAETGAQIALQLAQLAQLALASNQGSKGMGSGISAPSSSNRPMAQGSTVSKAAEKDPEINSVGSAKTLELPDVDLNKAKAKGAEASSKAGKKDLSLKNKLEAKLRADESAESGKGAAANFSTSAYKNSSNNHAAASVTSELLSPNAEAGGDYNSAGGNKGSGAFSLSTSETNAEVKRLTDEADRQLIAADDAKAGILEVESPSLFERVSTRINGCLRQRCVNSKSLAKN